MSRLLAKILVLSAVVGAACSLGAGTASAAWRYYDAHGTLGTLGQPHLTCTRSNGQLQFTVSHPAVGGREPAVHWNADGSHTIDATQQEWVGYQATLMKPSTSGGWTPVISGTWWATFTGPFNPNIGPASTTSWFNLALQKWDYQIVQDDGIGGLHPLQGGPTTITAPAGPAYAIRVEYYWWSTAQYGAASVYTWETDPCGYPYSFGG